MLLAPGPHLAPRLASEPQPSYLSAVRSSIFVPRPISSALVVLHEGTGYSCGVIHCLPCTMEQPLPLAPALLPTAVAEQVNIFCCEAARRSGEKGMPMDPNRLGFGPPGGLIPAPDGTESRSMPKCLASSGSLVIKSKVCDSKAALMATLWCCRGRTSSRWQPRS
jgi:hypothetical protein